MTESQFINAWKDEYDINLKKTKAAAGSECSEFCCYHRNITQNQCAGTQSQKTMKALVEREYCANDYAVRYSCMCVCASVRVCAQLCLCGRGGWQKGSSVQALTDGHVITVRKSMLLDLRLPHTFISLAAGQLRAETSHPTH